MAGNSHGHTPAAWTGVTIAFIGFCVAAAFVVLAEPIGMFAGLAVAALGGVVGLGMRAAGLGKAMPEKQRG
ncbi:HGxxPAAW family protein [Streptomyces sp. NPDC005722]